MPGLDTMHALNTFLPPVASRPMSKKEGKRPIIEAGPAHKGLTQPYRATSDQITGTNFTGEGKTLQQTYLNDDQVIPGFARGINEGVYFRLPRRTLPISLPAPQKQDEDAMDIETSETSEVRESTTTMGSPRLVVTPSPEPEQTQDAMMVDSNSQTMLQVPQPRPKPQGQKRKRNVCDEDGASCAKQAKYMTMPLGGEDRMDCGY